MVTHADADRYNSLPDELTDDVEVGQVLLVEADDDYEVPEGDFAERWIVHPAKVWIPQQ